MLKNDYGVLMTSLITSKPFQYKSINNINLKNQFDDH